MPTTIVETYFPNTEVERRAEEIFRDQQQLIYARTDRLFGAVMIFQWLAGIVAAFCISPFTWIGLNAQTHIHVWMAIFLGGIISALPVYLAFFHSGEKLTRHVIACAQLLMSALLIHISGGRIEAHFHVFCSLAFLALYRDVRIFILPTLIVATDHFIRGMLWPESVYGTSAIEPLRWLEHSCWVLFEDTVLIISCLQSNRHMRAYAARQAEVEMTKDIVERAVIERTVDLEAAKNVALQASASKSQFVANMSHEIRTPMSGVIGMTEMLLDTELTPEQQQMVEMANTSARSLLTLLNDILDFSKIEAQKLDIESVAYSPVSLVKEVTSIFLVQAQSKGLLLQSSISDALPSNTLGDPVRVRQVLINLVSNAIKFTDKGSVSISASVKTTGEQQYLHFEIEDTGIGIAEHAKPILFEPFMQADNSNTRRHGGTGLGLSISKRLMELMDGEIGFESQLGVGTKFWFRLPVIINEDFSLGKSPDTPVRFVAAIQADAPIVMVVEDDLVMRTVTGKKLLKLGLTPLPARNGREALQLLAENNVAAILMDCQMPVLDGFATTAAIREAEQKSGKHLAIIAMTAAAMEGDREKCLAAGMDDYLSKPFSDRHLAKVLSRWIPTEAITQPEDDEAVR